MPTRCSGPPRRWGYFDWTREHTAEEVADRLGVASATLLYHLRAAQRTLVLEALGTSEE